MAEVEEGYIRYVLDVPRNKRRAAALPGTCRRTLYSCLEASGTAE